MSQAGASTFPCLKVPFRGTFSGRTWPQLHYNRATTDLLSKAEVPMVTNFPRKLLSWDRVRTFGVFSINECTAEIGQRPLTRRYGLAYDTASMTATPQSREKCWRGWSSACTWPYAEELIHWWESNDKCLIHICAKWRFCEPKSNDLAKDLLLSNSIVITRYVGIK